MVIKGGITVSRHITHVMAGQRAICVLFAFCPS